MLFRKSHRADIVNFLISLEGRFRGAKWPPSPQHSRAQAESSLHGWHGLSGCSHPLSVGETLLQAEGQRWVKTGPSLRRLRSHRDTRHVTVITVFCDEGYSKRGWCGCLRWLTRSWAGKGRLNLGSRRLGRYQSLTFSLQSADLAPRKNSHTF